MPSAREEVVAQEPQDPIGLPEQPMQHIKSLDGIRGLAILLVMAGHLFGSTSVSSNPFVQILYSLRGLIWTGVNLFFALSGFLITTILYETLGSPDYFRSFFARRILRIFPLYYGVLLILLALTPFLAMDWNGTAITFLTYTQNLPFRGNPIGPAPWASLRHFWSLAVEEQFYLIWPFVIFWLRTWKRIMLAVIVGCVLALIFRTAVALAGGNPQNHATPFCMDGLLAGAALALLIRSRYRAQALRYGLSIFLAASLCIVAPALRRANFDWETSFYLTTIGLTIVNVGAAGFIAAALRPGSATCRIFSAAGYGFSEDTVTVYTSFHNTVGELISSKLHPVLVAHGMGKALSTLIPGFIAVGVSVVIAVASYQLYEVRFLRLKRFFVYRTKAVPVGSTA